MTEHHDVPEIPREIYTERLLLRPIQESDAVAVIEAIDESRAELDPWMAWAPHMREPDDVRQLVKRVRAGWAAREDFGLGIFRRDDGRFLGGTGMHRPNWAVPSLEIGYWMRTSDVGKSYVREAVIGLTRLGFGQLGVRRMAITCAATNVRSRRVAESTGYVLEGRLRNDDRLPNGELRDTLVFSLIDSDEVVRQILRDSSKGK